jgi:hypothetical protein
MTCSSIAGRIVLLTKRVSVMFKIIIVCSKNCAAARLLASEMLGVEFATKSSDVAASESFPTGMTQKIEASEIVDLTQRYLFSMPYGRVR